MDAVAPAFPPERAFLVDFCRISLAVSVGFVVATAAPASALEVSGCMVRIVAAATEPRNARREDPTLFISESSSSTFDGRDGIFVVVIVVASSTVRRSSEFDICA